MRFSVTYDVTGQAELPIDYRSGFMALIKTALDNNIGYTKSIFQDEPFCFAIRFDKKPDISNGNISIGKKLTLYVTSPSPKLLTNIYNGLLSIKEFPVFKTKISNPKFSYINEDIIHQDEIVFVTLSPIVIRNAVQKDRYVTPKDGNFTESFLHALEEQYELHNKSYLELSKNSVELIKYRKVAVSHYNSLVLGFTGLLRMHADQKVLNFFYQSGIGYRRSNGFGFVMVDHH